MANYATHVSRKVTPQNEPIPGKPMEQNSAGGYTFVVDDWARLDRWLILGADGGTYYATERKLTRENAACVERCLVEDGPRAVARIVEISESGRAPKNDPAIFALALAAASTNVVARMGAMVALPRVCRIPTHLFQWLAAVEQFRGHGRSLNTALKRWYTEKPLQQLAYHMTKYQQRDGWAHRDVLRLCKPKSDGMLSTLFRWATKGWETPQEVEQLIAPMLPPHPDLTPVWALEKAKKAESKEEIVRLIRDYELVRECVPTQWLNEACVWEALLEKMPLTAMIRNLATMTRIGLLAPLSNAVGKVLAELTNGERLKKSRVHPIQVLSALLTYQLGHSVKGSSTWTPVQQVVDALDGAFYAVFGNVDSTGKRWLLALDVSGSMGMGTIAGVPGLSPRVASAAMALVTANVELQHHFIGFTSSGWKFGSGQGQWSASHAIYNGITPLSISPRMRLNDVCQYTASLPMGGTDCALPMLYATANKIPVDAFVVLTDNETWANPCIHPCQALIEYQQKMGIPAKLIVVGMTSAEFSIADPSNANMLDVVGFDTATPQLMSSFVAG